MSSHQDFFDYFQREVSYLRYEGARFARAYPKVAARLDFSNVESSDPHVERLLQSFSFLTARLQKDIDDLFPRISTALLETLYPQFIAPLPSYTITKFALSDDNGKLTSPTKINRGTQLYVHGDSGEICRFQTTADVTLAPIKIKNVSLISSIDLPKKAGSYASQRLIRIDLRSTAGSFKSQELKSLRFHIVGNPILQNKIYEALFLGEAHVGFKRGPTAEEKGYYAPQPNRITPVGFAAEEAVIPYPDHGHPGFRLLQEYFAYPQKFMFVDIDTSVLQTNEKEASIFIEVDDTVGLNPKDFDANTFQLGCVPIVNIFKKLSEPIRIDYKKPEYRLLADQRRQDTTEIHTISSVYATETGRKKPIKYSPFFSFTHKEAHDNQSQFWHSRRVYSDDPQAPGNDTYISFVDHDFDIDQPDQQTIYAEVLCTNRGLAESLSAGTELQSDQSIPCGSMYCLNRPTPQRYMNQETMSQWRLISQLAMGHLSLADNQNRLDLINELLIQHGDFGDGIVIPETTIMKTFSAKRVARRLGYDAWRGFVHGTKFTMTLRENISQDTTTFLFTSVLNAVLPQFAAINSFTELEVHKENARGPWKQWQPRSGNKALV